MAKNAYKHQLVDHGHALAEIKTVSIAHSHEKPLSGYHYHNSCQIVVLQQGSAEYMVNCMLFKIERHSIILFGSDLPHGVISYSKDVKATIIHIPYSALSWGNGITELENEMKFIRESRQGYLFTSSPLYTGVMRLIKKLQVSDGFRRVAFLFEMLNLLSNDPDRERLVVSFEDDLRSKQVPAASDAVDRVYGYLYKNFERDISLKEIAEYVHQNPASLCRAFKKRSGYTLSQFMNRLRIEKACRLLITTDLTVTQIAFQVGYNTFSHFSTQFMRLVHLSPGDYRRKHDKIKKA